MRTRTIQQSFGGGRMSPDMLGRPEDPRVRFGLSKAYNVRTTTSGGFESRTGTQYLATAPSSTRQSIVRPFVSSPTDAVVLAITGWDSNPSNYGVIRFLSNGSLVPLAAFPAFWTQSGSLVFSFGGTGGITIRVGVTGHGFSGGETVRFTTTTSLPGPLEVGVTYYVRSIVDADKFTVSYDPNGTEIVSDGTSTPGTHTVYRRYLKGDVVTRSGTTYTALVDNSAITPGVTGGWATYWYAQSGTYFEIPHQYADADLYDLDMSSQEGNTLTVAHRSYPVRELVRESATFWRLRDVVFGASVPAPQWDPTGGITVTPGEIYDVTAAANSGAPPTTRLILTVATPHPYAVGEVIYVEGITDLADVPDGFYVVGAKNVASTTVDLKTLNGGAWFAAGSGTWVSGGTIRAASPSSILTNYYLLTSVDSEDRESVNGPGLDAFNNLEVLGAYNTLSWLSVSGAAYYNVYRFENGIYELLGSTQTTTFRDDGDPTDSEVTVPFQDGVLNNTTSDYPGCASLFEGRRWFLSTNSSPLGVWATRSGTSSDLNTHLPVLPDDRLSFRIKSQSSTINHAIAQSQTLLVLTDSEEIRVAAVESGALTADQPIPARPITRNGSTKRRPAVVGGTVVFENRGGQLLELGFRSDSGWSVQSLSERCADWFDGYSLTDGISVQRSPIPTLWAVQSDGRLLGLTYAPEQAVAGWHEHVTDGEFESVCCIPEGREDAVYVVVKRNIDGSDVRYFERMAPRYFSSVDDRRYLDSFLTYDGTNTTATTLTLTGGTDWEAGESITLTASSATFAYPATTDVGDQIKWLGEYRVRITATSSTTVATGTIIDDFAEAPAAPSAVWAWGRDTMTGLSHLEGKLVQIVADGVVLAPKTVSSGTVALTTRAVLGSPSTSTVGFKVHIGLGYTAEAIPTVPAVPVDGLGQGRMGSTTHVHVRMRRSAPFYIGPLGGPSQSLNKTHEDDDFTGPSREVTDGKFTLDKQIRMVQTDPLPMVVTGAVYTLTWGD